MTAGGVRRLAPGLGPAGGPELPGVLGALAREPRLWALLAEVGDLAGSAAARPAPGAWLALAQAAGRLSGLGLPGLPALPPLPPPGAAGSAKTVDRICRQLLALRPCVAEIGRRLGGVGALDPRTLGCLAALAAAAAGAVQPLALLAPSRARWAPGGVELSDLGLTIASRALARFFQAAALPEEEAEFAADAPAAPGPPRAALFVATLGPGLPAAAAAAFAGGEPVRGVLLDALGSALAEEAARSLAGPAAKALGPPPPGGVVRRFCVGFGDWELQAQADLWRILEPGRIGVSLTPAFLMVPEKSVAGLLAWKGRGSVPGVNEGGSPAR